MIGEKSGNDYVLLTILERNTRNAIVPRIVSKTADTVMNELSMVISLAKYSKQ